MRIFKYKLNIEEIQFVAMPKGAKVLTVQTQKGYPCIWAIVDPQAEIENKKICMRGTGHDASEVKDMCYIGTFQRYGGEMIFHVFIGEL